ncbi:MAG: phosphoribosylamine--glycine ligase [Phycisphaerales bacterium]|nr:phosphoribosylamine--glycine ligase [Phycisphaerales bacterium]
MNVLVIGGGGREHAICHQLRRSPLLKKLFVLPGNAGTTSIATNIAGSATDIALALEVARRESIDLTIVGPEDPLAAGVVDAFQKAGRRIFGPSAAAARLESDKAFAKQLMRQYVVPTAEARVFDRYDLAHQYIATRDEALVVKAAGLAKGKGVIVCDDPSQALLAAEDMLVKRVFGDAGSRIVVEEKLDGREVSVLALVEGHTIALLEPARDYKRLRDDDAGPNTGGMGSYSRSDLIDEATMRLIESQIFVPLLDGLVREEIPYCGVLYAGLMLTPAGPKVLEFNCRFGDPETQALLMRLNSDLLVVVDAALNARLDEVTLAWDTRPSVCVVMAAPGYPDRPELGERIDGLSRVSESRDLAVFHAGTQLDAGRVITSGGRVLSVSAVGDSLTEAADRAYAVVENISFRGATYRRDIGRKN